ncbi:MAG: hypothetical protein ABJB66_10530 [Gemmatimonadaceae bacterium]
MSCLSRVGCAAVLLVGGACAWWLYGGTMPDAVRKAASKVVEARPEGTSKAVTWASLTDARISSAEALSTLERPTGPAFVTLAAGDVAGFLAEALRPMLPGSAVGAQVAITDDVLRLRAAVPLRELGGDLLPSLLNSVLKSNDERNGTTVGANKSVERDTVELAGTLEVIRPGLGQFRVREFRVRGIDVPPRLIPPILSAMRKRGATTDSTASDAVSIVLPKSIADVRVQHGKVTLYKAAPAK